MSAQLGARESSSPWTQQASCGPASQPAHGAPRRTLRLGLAAHHASTARICPVQLSTHVGSWSYRASHADGRLLSRATGDTRSPRIWRNDRVRATASVSLGESERPPRTNCERGVRAGADTGMPYECGREAAGGADASSSSRAVVFRSSMESLESRTKRKRGSRFATHGSELDSARDIGAPTRRSTRGSRGWRERRPRSARDVRSRAARQRRAEPRLERLGSRAQRLKRCGLGLGAGQLVRAGGCPRVRPAM